MNRERYQPDDSGNYGEFGGAYIPEMLVRNISDLKQNYLSILEDPGFLREFHSLLRDYSGRPTPLFLANRLSEKYGTTIYLKREDLNHTGAHKINNCVGQVLLALRMGKRRIIAETGAGQHGVATATVCALKGLECVIYMGATDVERQAPNVAKMKMLGAKVVPVHSGNKTLKDATNEAMRDWINHPEETHYIIGSVVGPHPYPDLVSRLQAVISYELQVQLREHTGRSFPDAILACVGGGSNAAGGFYAFLDQPAVRLMAAEAAGKGVDSGHSAATLALGTTGILHGSKSIVMQDKYGQITEPYSISAGLDYPGVGPQHAHLFRTGRCEYYSVTDQQALAAALELSRLEGIIPALETAHALAVLPLLKWEPHQDLVIILSGRGDKDMATYIQHLENE